MIDQRLSVKLDQCRWLAALFVVAAHLRNLLFVNYAALRNKGIALKLFYFLTGFGHEAVIVFFVISGILVGGTALHEFREKRFSIRNFFIRRFSRIYIVLIPALLIGYLLDNVGLGYFNDSQLYTHSEWYSFNAPFAARSSWDILLGNALMLHHIVVPTFGSNEPLWSLAYEWWYYCLFCFAIGLAGAANGRLARTCHAALIVFLFLVLPAKLLIWFLLWLLGAAIGTAPLNRIRISPIFGYILFFGALALARVGHATYSGGLYVDFTRDLTVAAGFCALLMSFSRQKPAVSELTYGGKIHRNLAAFSYTTYLFHFPFMIFIAAFLSSVFGFPLLQQPSLSGIVCYLLLLGFIYLFTYAMSRLTEAQTGKLRRFLTSGPHFLAVRRPVPSGAQISDRP